MKHLGPVAFDMPADFIERARGRSKMQLASLYGVSHGVISRWRKEAGIFIYKRAPWLACDDEYLKTNYTRLPIPEIAANLNRSEGSVKRRAVYLQLSTGRPRGWNFNTSERAFSSNSRRLVDMRSTNLADLAADHIRTHDRTPVYRCDRNGRANPKANFWKYGYGSVVLTEAELFAKAERKGWSSDSWKMLAA